ncbi:transcription factor bHLH118-like [Euphorbia lathyris]|uniref:transcription factor bHLH118-like n=1 Tax=Euphorbia lathyris TaxID=212925 RepID=UPI0033140F67
MFPFQQGSELCFQISSNPNQQQNIPRDLLLDRHNHRNQLYRGSDSNIGKSRRRSAHNGENSNDNDKRKLLHRDIERKRRQEMATLHASLRSLLPLEYIKGRRSMSDHMHEAANYIKHLRKRISELNARKDELEQQTDLRSIPSQMGSSSNESSPTSAVIIRPCLDGVEVVFSSGLKDQRSFTLSRVLRILLQNGVSVVNCVSTTINERLFHTVKAEVKDPACLNLSELQQRLNPLVP